MGGAGGGGGGGGGIPEKLKFDVRFQVSWKYKEF